MGEEVADECAECEGESQGEGCGGKGRVCSFAGGGGVEWGCLLCIVVLGLALPVFLHWPGIY